MKKIVIAIDGHSSTGKSTVAKSLAKRLSYVYIDSGAMYRCVALFGIQNKWVKDGAVDSVSLISELKNCRVEFKAVGNVQHAFLNGEDVELKIRGLEVSQNVSPVATIKEVREFLVAQQQKMGEDKGIVMDGRDIGTVVFPNAELKVFMTASPEIRAQRRYDEMKAKGDNHEFATILENVIERDRMDENRAESPLRQAGDAVLLNNGNLTREQQLDWITDRVNEIIN